MGRKPSMFSKDYRRQLKLRRIKYIVIFLVVVIIIGVGGLVITNKDSILAIKKFFIIENRKEDNKTDINSEKNEDKNKENLEKSNRRETNTNFIRNSP